MTSPLLIDLPTASLQRCLVKRGAMDKALFAVEGLLLPRGVRRGRWHRDAIPFENHPVVPMMRALLDPESKVDQQESALRTYYEARGKSPAHAAEKAQHIREDYVREYRALWESLRTHGYIAGVGKDEIGVAIGPDGEFIKVANGNHRLAAARLAGVDQVVAEVRFVHSAWLRHHARGPGTPGKRIEAALKTFNPRWASAD